MKTFYRFFLFLGLSLSVTFSQTRTPSRGGDDGRLKRVEQPKPVTPPPSNPVVPHNGGSPDPIDRGPVYHPHSYNPIQIDVILPNPDPPVCTIPITNPASSANAFTDYKALGNFQFDGEDYFSAIESYEKALERDTSDYSLYYQIGLTQIALERYPDAIHNFTDYINSVINNGRGYFQRGLAKFYLGNKDNALNDFLIADKLNVEDAKPILKRYYNYY
jgi:tetratricopeptide (TPR) repeat protein